jgi:Leucine-rich repeat (LRR) protein
MDALEAFLLASAKYDRARTRNHFVGIGGTWVTLPKTFKQWSTLTTLVLYGNKKSTLPDAFGNLTALTTLHVS